MKLNVLPAMSAFKHNSYKLMCTLIGKQNQSLPEWNWTKITKYVAPAAIAYNRKKKPRHIIKF